MKINQKTLTSTIAEVLIEKLKNRFEKNRIQRERMDWSLIEKKLRNSPNKLWSLNEMEQSGGEPDVLEFDKKNDHYIFYDCAAESPIGRRSFCYDEEALKTRKENKPLNSVIHMAAAMGIELLNEAQYRELQKRGIFDLKTSSWVQTPKEIRKLGGALFCDRRYDQVFVYHNGAESYYAARGFRASLTL